MAMSKCRECGAQVSDSAKMCPNCGVSKPVKKTSAAAALFVVLFVLGAAATTLRGGDESSSSGSSSSGGAAAPKAPAKLSETDLAKNVTVKDFRWQAGGFGGVMILDQIQIVNSNTEAVKDFDIECVHSAPSGTVIDRNSKTIYQVLPAGKTTVLKAINMGFINTQAKSSRCSITSVKRV